MTAPAAAASGAGPVTAPPPAGLRAFRHLGPSLRPWRGTLAVGFFCVIATQAAQAWLPIAFRHSIEALEGKYAWGFLDAGERAVSGPPDADLALFWAGLFLAATAVRGLFQWMMRLLIVGVSREMERDLRDRLFAKVVRQSPAALGRLSTGDVMSRFTSDLESVRMSVGPGLMYVANTVAVLPWAVAAMFLMSPVLAWMNLLPLGVLAIGARLVTPRMHSASTEQQEAQAALSTQAQESFAGVRVIKSFAREEAEEAEFRKKAGRSLDAALGVADVQALFWPLIGFLKWVGFVLTVWVGGRMMARGELSLGTFLAFHLYAGMLLWPMISLGWVLAMWQRGRVSMNRLAAILEAPRGVDDPAEPARIGAPRGEIEVRALTFTHAGSERPSLADVSFRVAPGRTLAVVGATGSGKSTLLATIPRLLDPPPGTVLLDGVPVERLALRELRALVGYVPQDTFLFSDTVGANIALGLPSDEPVPEKPGDEPRVRRAAEQARILPEIERLPQGFDTLLGERGVNLSGGQRQRTAIARALVRDPRILLLDDCLSAVDAKTEVEILANLREIVRGRTTILVTHRVSAAKLADDVLVLDDGRVVERGTPQELLAAGGPFARLARRQSLEEALEAA